MTIVADAARPSAETPPFGVAYAVAHPALRFVARRLAIGLLTLLVASILIFIATNILPGNAAVVVLGRGATPAVLHHLEVELGLDRSVAVRYLSWLGGMLHGNFGHSAVAEAEGRPNSAISATLGSPLADSAILAALTTLLLIPLTLLLGVLAGLFAG
ncbi:MAG TPA: hypothetical protein VEH29_13410, partial [Acidimicrobiales bacterium]|nr:hypothetical protein [Acidimicrobiales bacterium]